MWLDRWYLVPPTLLGARAARGRLARPVLGLPAETVLLWHSTFTINSLCHIWGKRRYETTGHQPQQLAVRLHRPGRGLAQQPPPLLHSTRQGFLWWEVDLTYYVLKAMSWLGLVWDLKAPPARVYGADLQPADATSTEAEAAA